MTYVGFALILPALYIISKALWPVVLYVAGRRKVNFKYTDEMTGQSGTYRFYHEKGDDLDQIFDLLSKGNSKE